MIQPKDSDVIKPKENLLSMVKEENIEESVVQNV